MINIIDSYLSYKQEFEDILEKLKSRRMNISDVVKLCDKDWEFICLNIKSIYCQSKSRYEKINNIVLNSNRFHKWSSVYKDIEEYIDDDMPERGKWIEFEAHIFYGNLRDNIDETALIACFCSRIKWEDLGIFNSNKRGPFIGREKFLELLNGHINQSEFIEYIRTFIPIWPIPNKKEIQYKKELKNIGITESTLIKIANNSELMNKLNELKE